jgi:hypothetical protein
MLIYARYFVNTAIPRHVCAVVFIHDNYYLTCDELSLHTQLDQLFHLDPTWMFSLSTLMLFLMK